MNHKFLDFDLLLLPDVSKCLKTPICDRYWEYMFVYIYVYPYAHMCCVSNVYGNSFITYSWTYSTSWIFFCSISQKKKITVKAYYINFSMLTGERTLAGNDFKVFKMWSAFEKVLLLTGNNWLYV